MVLRLIPRIHRATHELGIFIDRHRRQIPVTQPEAHVLAYLSESNGVSSVLALHRSFGHKRSTLTGIVDRLEARRLLERHVHPTDRRSLELRLTTSGQRLGVAVRRRLEGLERAALTGLSARDLAGFDAVLDALERAGTG
jgi:DNA-binding MarR family transcriptional regulator